MTLSEYSSRGVSVDAASRPTQATGYGHWLLATSILLVAAASPALAFQPETTLGKLMNTELRQRTGDAVQFVCGGLIGTGNDRDLTTEETDLLDRCGNMVNNANELTGTGSTDKSLGLGESELQETVQTVANEELAATKSMTTEMAAGQANSAIARLYAVRSGVRFGVAGLGIDGFDALAEMDPRARAELGLRGGAAGDEGLSPWGFFINGHYGFGERDETSKENGFDFDHFGLTAGIDYQINDELVLGGMLSYGEVDSDFDKSAAVPGGGVDADNWGIGVYGTYYRDNYYVDGLIGYNRVDYDIKREILLRLGPTPGPDVGITSDERRTAKGSTESDDFSVSVGGGMDFADGSISYGPFARLSYVNASVDGYSESGAFGLNLTVDDVEWESLTSVIGGRIGASLSRSWGVLVPQVRLGWVHEFMNDSEDIKAVYTVDPNKDRSQNTLVAITDDPDRDYFELGLGVSAVLRGETQVFFDYETLLGHKHVEDHVFTAGVRSAF